MKANYYRIDGVNEMFKTLFDAKHHVYVAYTANERIKYLHGTSITHVVGDDVVSITPIKIDENGGYSFGRTVKY